MDHHGAALTTREITRRKMAGFYGQYLPDKVASVEGILDQYRGREELIIKAMKMKYPGYNFDDVPPDAPAAGTPAPRRPSASGPDSPSATNIHLHIDPASFSPTVRPVVAPPPAHPYAHPSPVHAAFGSPAPFVDIHALKEGVVTALEERLGRHHPAAAPPPPRPAVTREQLEDGMYGLQEKLLRRQRDDMLSLEEKIQQLMAAQQAAAPAVAAAPEPDAALRAEIQRLQGSLAEQARDLQALRDREKEKDVALQKDKARDREDWERAARQEGERRGRERAEQEHAEKERRRALAAQPPPAVEQALDKKLDMVMALLAAQARSEPLPSAPPSLPRERDAAPPHPPLPTPLMLHPQHGPPPGGAWAARPHQGLSPPRHQVQQGTDEAVQRLQGELADMKRQHDDKARGLQELQVVMQALAQRVEAQEQAASHGREDARRAAADAEHRYATAAAQQQAEVQALQRALEVQAKELEQLRAKEGARLEQEVTAHAAMAKVQQENDVLKEEGAEARGLISELHSLVEQLRHANDSKDGEIECLLHSAQTLKSYLTAGGRAAAEPAPPSTPPFMARSLAAPKPAPSAHPSYYSTSTGEYAPQPAAHSHHHHHHHHHHPSHAPPPAVYSHAPHPAPYAAPAPPPASYAPSTAPPSAYPPAPSYARPEYLPEAPPPPAAAWPHHPPPPHGYDPAGGLQHSPRVSPGRRSVLSALKLRARDNMYGGV